MARWGERDREGEMEITKTEKYYQKGREGKGRTSKKKARQRNK